MTADVLCGLGLAAVVLLSVIDVRLAELRARASRRPRPRSPARRCPFCHRAFADDEAETAPGDARVFCAACRTAHHADCWRAHRSTCSVFACGSRRTDGAPAPEDDAISRSAAAAPDPDGGSGWTDPSPCG